MRFLRNILRISPAARREERRGDPRLRQHWVGCSLGEVADFSVSGMRAAMTGKRAAVTQGQRLDVQIEGAEGSFTVPAVVIWVRTTGPRSHEAGLRFLNVAPETRAHLAAMARAPEVGPLGAPHPRA